MIRILGMLNILILAMATISIDYSFAEKPISYSRFEATKDQMAEGTPITIHGIAYNIQGGLLSDRKLTEVDFTPLDKDGNTWMNSKSLKLSNRITAYFLTSGNEFLIRNYGGKVGESKIRRFNPYDSTMLDRILEFKDTDTKVEIRGLMVKTRYGPQLVIETIEPLENVEKDVAKDAAATEDIFKSFEADFAGEIEDRLAEEEALVTYGLTIKIPNKEGEIKIDAIKVGELKTYNTWTFLLTKSIEPLTPSPDQKKIDKDNRKKLEEIRASLDAQKISLGLSAERIKEIKQAGEAAAQRVRDEQTAAAAAAVAAENMSKEEKEEKEEAFRKLQQGHDSVWDRKHSIDGKTIEVYALTIKIPNEEGEIKVDGLRAGQSKLRTLTDTSIWDFLLERE